jgi:hypothetical protein
MIDKDKFTKGFEATNKSKCKQIQQKRQDHSDSSTKLDRKALDVGERAQSANTIKPKHQTSSKNVGKVRKNFKEFNAKQELQ